MFIAVPYKDSIHDPSYYEHLDKFSPYLGATVGINSSTPGQNGRHLADDLFRCTNDFFCILIKFFWSLFLGSNWQYGGIGLDNG